VNRRGDATKVIFIAPLQKIHIQITSRDRRRWVAGQMSHKWQWRGRLIASGVETILPLADGAGNLLFFLAARRYACVR
jgi:hypothetical protein